MKNSAIDPQMTIWFTEVQKEVSKATCTHNISRYTIRYRVQPVAVSILIEQTLYLRCHSRDQDHFDDFSHVHMIQDVQPV